MSQEPLEELKEVNDVPEVQRQPPKWWFIELWWESRDAFKELVKHILFFGMLIGALALFHVIIKNSGLPDEQKKVFDKVHFYISLIVLVIFSVSFIIKIIKFEYQGIKG